MAKRTSTKKKTTTKAIAKKKVSKPRKKPVPRTRTIEFDDQKYKIATIGPGRNISEADKIGIAGLVCIMYATDQYSLDECLNNCGIKSDGTWWNWLDQIKEIEPLYIEAQRQKDRRYRHKLVHRARTMAERLVDGYTVNVEEREAEAVRVKNDKGEETIQMQTTKVKRKEVVIRPSVKMIENVLFNMDAKMYEKNPKPVEKMNKDVNIPPIKWVE
ncbi:MAG: hypothetical protein ACPGTS_02190 [Minisyncoccia bacterium]